jgi:hypothetical protein
MNRYIRLFEEFSNEPHYTDVLDLLKEGDFEGAKAVLYGLANLNQKNRRIYEDYMSPSELLERETGITGISRRWRMPFGFNEKELQFLHHLAFVFSKEGYTEERIWIHRMILDALVGLNPDLSVADSLIKNGGRWAMDDIIMGCISRFNLDDMEFFILDTPSGEDGRRRLKTRGVFDPEYTELMTEVERLSGDNIQWFASPRTLRSIIKKLGGG